MQLHYEYLPATDAAQQDLVLLHGWGCNLEVWRSLLVLLRPWANITLLDLPGCAPGAVAGEAPRLSELLARILDCSPERAVYVGWSLGGQLAIELAVRAPERVLAVVTLCSNPRFVAAGDWPGMGEEAFSTFHAAVQSDPVAALRRFDTLQVTGSRQPRRLRRLLQDLRRPSASGTLLAGLGWLETLDQRETLSLLRQPQLHLLAERDALVPSAVGAAIATRIVVGPLAEIKLLRGASHLAPLEVPDDVARELHGFLAATDNLRLSPSVGAELDKKDVAASFSRAAASYESAARLQRDIGTQLLNYLDSIQCAPSRILDLGCGTGFFCPALRRRYPQAQYLGLDLAAGMVAHARNRHGIDCDWLVADAEALPLASASVDLVFSSLALQWCYRPVHLFAELARVLRPGGWCVFTTLGPQTLSELRSAWASVDAHQHVNTFLPITALTSAAGRVSGVELTLERKAYRMEYARVRELLDELKALGAHNMNRSRPTGLTSRRALQGMLQAYESRRSAGVLPATYDVVFGVLEKA
jgi:malonyl-CoA O-methyltransferase